MLRCPAGQRRPLAILVPVLLLSACSATESDAPSADEWRGTVTTEGDLTMVVNEGGSVWGGVSVLVEEASIGLLEGADEYMLGSVGGVAADAERIYVADWQIPIVRAYDRAGRYLYDIGGAGEGPGEYQQPASVTLGPDGDVYVRDDRGRRILRYSPAGEHLHSFALAGGLQTGTPMLVDAEGTPYSIVIAERLENDPLRLWILGMQAHDAEGPVGEPITPPSYEFERGVIVARRNGGTSMNNVPFWPSEHWAYGPELEIASGVATEYRFELRRRDGSRLVVERPAGEPVPVDPDEARWYRAQATVNMRGMVPDWQWNGPEVPTLKPAFTSLVVARSGEIWVLRPGAGVRIEPCDEDAETSEEFGFAPCWKQTQSADVFGADGRFHGTVELPPGLASYPQWWIEGDELIGRVEDEDGTVQVKRYRRALLSDVRETT